MDWKLIGQISLAIFLGNIAFYLTRMIAGFIKIALESYQDDPVRLARNAIENRLRTEKRTMTLDEYEWNVKELEKLNMRLGQRWAFVFHFLTYIAVVLFIGAVIFYILKLK